MNEPKEVSHNDAIKAKHDAKQIAWWNKASTWYIAVPVLLLILFAWANGKPKASAQSPEPQPVVTTPKVETPVVVKPAPPPTQPITGDNNQSNTNNNTNKASDHSNIINGNGNRVNIITNNYYYSVKPTKATPPAAKTKTPPTKQPQECEDQMDKHLAQVAKWEAMFAK